MTYYKIVRLIDGDRKVSRYIYNEQYRVEYFTDKFSTSSIKRSGLLVYNERPNSVCDGEELWEVEIDKEMRLPKFRKNVDKMNNGYIDKDYNPAELDWPDNTVMAKKVRLVRKLG